MHDEWCQDKLSVNTKQTLGHIFEKLESNQIQQAFDLHVSLVRQAGGEVRSPFCVLRNASVF